MLKIRTFLAAAMLMVCPFTLLAEDVAPSAPVVPVTPIAPAATPVAKSVTLRYKFTQGQTRRYKLTTTMNGTMLTGQSGAGIPMNTLSTITMMQTVKDVRPSDGAATIESEIEDMQMSADGKESHLPQEQLNMMKKPYSSLMLPTGKVLSFQMPTMPAGGVPGLDMSKLMSKNNLSFPDSPLKVGDTWNGMADTGMTGIGLAMKVVSTLAGINSSGNSQLATINQKTNGTFDMTLSKGLPMTMKMKGNILSSSSQLFDTTAGALISQSAKTYLNMTMTFQPTPGKPAPSGMPKSMKMKMSQKIEMKQLDDTSQTNPPSPLAPVATVP